MKSFAFLLLTLAITATTPAQIVINEIYYNASSSHEGDEFVELINAGISPVALGGWSFTDGISFSFPPESTIAPGEYIVIAQNLTWFAQLAPGYSGQLFGPYEGKLSNSGERLALSDHNNGLIDEVEFSDKAPWPLAADGEGSSLELLNPGLDNALPSSWRASSHLRPTPGTQNSVFTDTPAPFISEASWSPQHPTSSDGVTVTARIESESAIQYATIFYGVGSSNHQAPMFDDGVHGDGVAGDGIYGATLPSQASQTIVRFHITAHNQANADGRSPHQSEVVGEHAYFVYDGEVQADAPVFWMEIPQTDLNWLSQNSASEETRTAWIVGPDLTVYPQVRVRHRGAGAPYWRKKSWKFFFNRGQEPAGGRVLNLNSQWAYDPTRLREYVSYKVFEMFDVPACRTEMVHLRINGQYWGLFTQVENVGGDYLKRNGLDDNGVMYKANARDDSSDFRLLPSETHYENSYEKETHEWESHDDLITFVEAINTGPWNNPEPLFQHLDIEEFTKYFCGIICLSGWDSITKNFYLHNQNPAAGEKWKILPWDVDRTWGEYHPGLAPWEPGTRVVYWTFLPLDHGSEEKPWPVSWSRLWNRYLKSETTDRYLHRELRRYVNTVFTEENLVPLWEQTYDRYKNEVAQDYAKWGVSEPENNYGLRFEIDRHIRYITERRRFILGHLRAPEPLINEVLVMNDGSNLDESGDPDPWLEIYNPGATPWDLTGHYLTDKESLRRNWPFPAGTTIPPFGYLVIWCDGEMEEGDLHASFTLNSQGGKIMLCDTDANGNLPLDSIAFGPQSPGTSYGRAADASWSYRSMSSPTPGFSNGRDPTPVQLDLTGLFTHDVIVNSGDLGTNNNDFMSLTTSFIEDGVGGAHGLPKDRRVGQFLLADYTGNNAVPLYNRSSDLIVQIDDQPYDAIRFLHTVGVNDASMQVDLVYTDGAVVSSTVELDYWGSDFNTGGAHAENLVPLNWMDRSNASLSGRERSRRAIFARQIAADPAKSLDYVRFVANTYSPSNTQGWLFAMLVIPPQPAGHQPVENLWINEWMADNDSFLRDEAGQYDDWMELYNANGDVLDVGGLFLSDDPLNPLKWQIPPGTIMPGNGFLLLWCDEDQSQGALHTNFKLSRAGETIGLYDRDGTRIDMVSFGEMETDRSHGRYPDASANVRSLNPPTPGTSNKVIEPSAGFSLY